MNEYLEPIVKIILFTVGIGGIVYTIFSLLFSINAKSWPIIVGVIEYCDLEEELDNDGDINYKANVTYSYEYRGRTYISKRVGYGLLSSNMRFMIASAYNKAIYNYPKAFIKVNPKRPSMATLLTGIHLYHTITLLFFIIFLSIAYLALNNQ